MHKRGLYIAVEGLDGTGKSTTMRLLAKKLQQNHKKFLITKEPYLGTAYAKAGWNKIEHNQMSRQQQIRYFATNGKWHRDHVVRPALKQGKIVITSRALASSLAYQGDYQRRGNKVVDVNHVLQTNQKIGDVKHHRPDENVYFEMKPTNEIKRLVGRTNKVDKFDRAMAHVPTIKKMQKKYHYALRNMKHTKLLNINADKGPKERADKMFRSIQNLQKQQIHQNLSQSTKLLGSAMSHKLSNFSMTPVNKHSKNRSMSHINIHSYPKKNTKKVLTLKSRQNQIHR